MKPLTLALLLLLALTLTTDAQLLFGVTPSATGGGNPIVTPPSGACNGAQLVLCATTGVLL